MALTIDGVVHANGDPLLVGGVQAQRVTCNGVEVWVNNYVAGAPTGFTASTTDTSTMTFNWALPANQGKPTCTYEIYEGTTLRATAGAGATSATWAGGTQDGTFHVVAVNAAGSSANSNTDGGSSWGGAASLTITSTRNITAGTDYPANITITAQVMGGGGGGGGGGLTFTYGGDGGGASSIVSGTFSAPATTTDQAAIGAGGGAGAEWPTCGGGGTGVASSIKGISSSGAGGGCACCIGFSSTNGASSSWGTGGNNGNSAGVGQPGGVGAGGGGGSTASSAGGAGGRGEIRLTW